MEQLSQMCEDADDDERALIAIRQRRMAEMRRQLQPVRVSFVSFHPLAEFCCFCQIPAIKPEEFRNYVTSSPTALLLVTSPSSKFDS